VVVRHLQEVVVQEVGVVVVVAAVLLLLQGVGVGLQLLVVVEVDHRFCLVVAVVVHLLAEPMAAEEHSALGVGELADHPEEVGEPLLMGDLL